MSAPTIHFPTDEEQQAALKEFARCALLVRAEQRTLADKARPALTRLVEVMRQRTGQSYKLRALLFSLWNGKPADVSDVLSLDWEIRKDFATVLLAFGFSDGSREFFYNAVEEELRRAGLFPWFVERCQEGGAS